MKDTNKALGNLVTNEVYIHLDVFGALMLHRVIREVDCTNIVTINKGGLTDGTM